MRSIDIHAHFFPQGFWKATEGGGDWHGMRRERDSSGKEFVVVGKRRSFLPPKAKWVPEDRISDMNSLGVDLHVLSTTASFYNHDLDLDTTIATATEANNEVYQLVKAWPQRFAGLATLPMQDVKAAISELERSVVQMGLKGAMINDHVNGRTYDEPDFLPFWKAAEQMGALIFFHQWDETLVTPRIRRYHLPNTVGNLVDRTVTFASLVFGGVMDACPNLKLCLAHGGGYACYGVGRMDRGWQVRPEARVNISQPPSTYLRRFYYDCLVYTEASLRFLIDTVGVDRVVFGTDWPYDMVVDDWPISWILGMTSLTQEEKELILYKNLERLLGL